MCVCVHAHTHTHTSQFGLSPPLFSLFSHSSSQNEFSGFQCSLSLRYYSCFNVACFTFLSFIVLVSVHCSVGFCLGILYCTLRYVILLITLFYLFTLYPVLFNNFQWVLLQNLNLIMNIKHQAYL
jgi:hypothetical protein